MEIIKINLEKLDKKIVQKTAQAIQKGKIVVVPTDTVYGLVGDATNKKAVSKIFRIKQRPINKPLGIFVGDILMARQYVTIKKAQEKYFKAGQTFVLPLKGILPLQRGTLGVRIPRSGLILRLLEIVGLPLAQTSANLSGQPAMNKIEEIIKIFRAQIAQPGLILDAGSLSQKKPSKVIDLTGLRPKVLRE